MNSISQNEFFTPPPHTHSLQNVFQAIFFFFREYTQPNTYLKIEVLHGN